MKVVFRVDASLVMGTGHLMRCLALADQLKAQGACCIFLSKEHEGHLFSLISQRGFPLVPLELEASSVREFCAETGEKDQLAHAHWLGGHWRHDAEQCLASLATLAVEDSQEGLVDWLIVDHYALDYRWQQRMRAACRHIMVIDDLADRQLDCDLLLDQTYGIDAQRYASRVPIECQCLLGPHFALLRDEFFKLAPQAADRRQGCSQPESVLLSLGGSDPDNFTGLFIQLLLECGRFRCITVVLGVNNLHRQALQAQFANLPQLSFRVAADNMAELMLQHDLAVGAAGSTSWERCVMGLPTLLMVTAANQQLIADNLARSGAVKVLTAPYRRAQLQEQLRFWCDKTQAYSEAARACQKICDGLGAARVSEMLWEK